MAKVVWTEKASDHLQAIYEYIAHDSAVYAGRFVRTLVKSTVKLESMPNCGRVVPEFNDAKPRSDLSKLQDCIPCNKQSSNCRNSCCCPLCKGFQPTT